MAPDAHAWVRSRTLPPAPWEWSDDTHMALSVVDILREHGEIDQDALASRFARRFVEDPYRGYGRGATMLLSRLARGEDWRTLAPQLFGGGSYGNGAAMRAAPIGAFFPDQMQRAAQQARASAVITHAHEEGQAGAIAVAVAASVAAGESARRGELGPDEFYNQVLSHTPDSETRDRIRCARSIPAGRLRSAVDQLGSGWNVSAQDTVPFCLWCVAYHLDDFVEGLWQTVAGSGDCDTTCAIVGGIVALSSGGVPDTWRNCREPLPEECERGG